MFHAIYASIYEYVQLSLFSATLFNVKANILAKRTKNGQKTLKNSYFATKCTVGKTNIFSLTQISKEKFPSLDFYFGELVSKVKKGNLTEVEWNNI